MSETDLGAQHQPTNPSLLSLSGRTRAPRHRMLRSACAHLEMELPFLRRITSLYLSEFTNLPMATTSANQRNKYMIRARSGEDTLTSGNQSGSHGNSSGVYTPVFNKHLKSDIDRYDSRSAPLGLACTSSATRSSTSGTSAARPTTPRRLAAPRVCAGLKR